MYDRHFYDYIQYHKLDLDWAAFLQILFNVNLGIFIIDSVFIYPKTPILTKEWHEKFALGHVILLLLFSHLIKLVFSRKFFSDDGKVHTIRWPLLAFHVFIFCYEVYMYFFTDARDKDISEAHKMWVPLDCLL